MDGHIGLYRGLGELGGIYVDLHLEGVRRERLPVVTGLAEGEARAEDQQDIGILHREISGAVADRTLASAEERIVGGDQIMGPRGGDWNMQAAEEFVEFGNGVSRTNTSTRQNHGALRLADSVKNLTTIGFQP